MTLILLAAGTVSVLPMIGLEDEGNIRPKIALECEAGPMTPSEAREECSRWLAHLDHQRERTMLMQQAAALARAGDKIAAREICDRVDRTPRVYDGARLEQAVRVLLELEAALRG